MELNRLFPSTHSCLKPSEIVPVLGKRALTLFIQQLPKDLFTHHTELYPPTSLEDGIKLIEANYQTTTDTPLFSPDGKLFSKLDSLFGALRLGQLWEKTTPTEDSIKALMQELTIPENIATIIARQRKHQQQFSSPYEFKMSLDSPRGAKSQTYFQEWFDENETLPILAEGSEPKAVKALLPFLTPYFQTETTDLMWRKVDGTSMKRLLSKAPQANQKEIAIRYDHNVIDHIHSYTITKVPDSPKLLLLTLYDNESNNIDDPALMQRTQVIVDTENAIMVILQNAFGLLANEKGSTRLKESEIANFQPCIPVSHRLAIPYALGTTLNEIGDSDTRKQFIYA